jgi:lysozyme family protein
MAKPKATLFQINKASRAIKLIQKVVQVIYLNQQVAGFKLLEALPKLSEALDYADDVYHNYKVNKNNMFYHEYKGLLSPTWKDAVNMVKELADAYQDVKSTIPELSVLQGKAEQVFLDTHSEAVWAMIDELLL